MDLFEWVLFIIMLSLAWFGFLSILVYVATYFMVQRIINNFGQQLNVAIGNADRAVDAKIDRVNTTIDKLGELVGRKPPLGES